MPEAYGPTLLPEWVIILAVIGASIGCFPQAITILLLWLKIDPGVMTSWYRFVGWVRDEMWLRRFAKEQSSQLVPLGEGHFRGIRYDIETDG